MSLRWAAASDVGKVRRLNEDSCLARQDAFVVADGMGGHRAGDVASRLTIEAVESLLTGSGLTVDVLPSIVAAANTRVRDEAVSSDQQGMGSTLVGAFLVDNGGDEEIAVVNVGDSRCYRLDGEHLRQLSRDHSYVQDLVDAGSISAAEARTHRERNVITRAIGIDSSVTADYYFLPTDGEYRFMLCSDGLSGEVDHAELESLMRDAESPEAAAQQLLAAALRGEAADNITVVVVDVSGRRTSGDGDADADDTATARRWPDADDTRPSRQSNRTIEVPGLIVAEWPGAATGVPAAVAAEVIDDVPSQVGTREAEGMALEPTAMLIEHVPEGSG